MDFVWFGGFCCLPVCLCLRLIMVGSQTIKTDNHIEVTLQTESQTETINLTK